MPVNHTWSILDGTIMRYVHIYIYISAPTVEINFDVALVYFIVVFYLLFIN